MVQISIDYTGQLHCSAIHGPSKTELVTDAPLDNLGRGEAFSPTDLVATALGTCIATTMGIVAQKHGIDLRGMTVNVTKEMANDPRRIGRLTSEVRIPLPPDHPQRELLEKTGLGCPVHRSLPAEMERPTKFFWEGTAE
jgi:putative redox protein